MKLKNLSKKFRPVSKNLSFQQKKILRTPLNQMRYRPRLIRQSFPTKKKNEKASTIGGIASGQDPIECGSFFNPGDNRTLRSVYKEDVTSGSVSSMSFNPVSWMCTACPRSHSVFEVKSGGGGRAGGRTVIVLCDQNFPAVLASVENHCLTIMRLDTFEELIDLFLKISKNVTVPEGTVILVGSISLLARVGVHGVPLTLALLNLLKGKV
jgi:hypothetical protein